MFFVCLSAYHSSTKARVKRRTSHEPNLGPDYMRPERTLTGTTQTGTIKFTWARSESMKWLHETGTRLQIGMNVYIKHA